MDKSEKEKRSLKLAVEELARKANRLEDLKNLAVTLPLKITQPYPEMARPTEDLQPEGKVDRVKLSLIDILYTISDHIDKNVDIIGSNIQKTIQLIE